MNATTTEGPTGPMPGPGRTPMSVVRAAWHWFVGLGILLIVMGLIALALPLVGAATALFLVAFPIIVAGAANVAHAFSTRDWSGFWGDLAVGAVYLLGGVLLLANPYIGIAGIALVLGIYFLVVGVARMVLAFQVAGSPGWGWMLASGVVAVMLGAIVLANWPGDAVWVLSVLIGVDLIFSGTSVLMLAMMAKNAADDFRERAEHR